MDDKRGEKHDKFNELYPDKKFKPARTPPPSLHNAKCKHRQNSFSINLCQVDRVRKCRMWACGCVKIHVKKYRGTYAKALI